MSKPKVSIVTITYNHVKYISQALDSFLSQETDFVFEIIVSDDASTDKTQEIIKDYAAKYPGIIKPILRRKNTGAVNNSNDALRAATGEFIALCEGDDYWIDDTKLQRQAELLDKNPGLGLCFHPAKVAYEHDESKDYIFPDLNEKPEFTPQELLKHNFIMTSSVMYRRRNYDNLPNNVLPLDWYYHLYHVKFGKIGFIDHVMSVYRRHPGSMWWSSSADDREVWQKHGLMHLNLYVEMTKLYPTDEAKEAIKAPVKKLFAAAMRLDKKHREELLGKAVKEFPEAAGEFMVEQQVEIENQTKDISKLSRELEKRIQSYDEIVRQLNYITNSRTWKLANKIEDVRKGMRKPRKP
jgi:glycosyltransferase involved in cell wall biosynthesis